MSFKDIQKQIAEDLVNKTKEPAVAQVPHKQEIQPVDEQGMPKPVEKTVIGTILSESGTEEVILNASTFQLMTCKGLVRGRLKERYCIVEIGVNAKFGNQFINRELNLTHIVTRQVFQVLKAVFAGVEKQLKKLSAEAETANNERDLYKTTVDALRKHGIID